MNPPTYASYRYQDPGSAARYGGTEDLAGAGLRDMFAALWRRKSVMLSCFAVALLIALAFVMLVEPRYQAEAHILIEPQDSGDRVVQTVANKTTADQEAIKSESYVLTSTALVGNVIERLQLHEEAEFNPTLREPGYVDRVMAWMGQDGQTERGGSKAADAAFDGRIIEAFRKRLTVAPVENARVISVQFVSKSAETAQLVANTVAREYMDLRERTKHDSTRQISGWLDRQIEQLRGKVEDGESQIETLRARHGLLESGDGKLQTQELAEVNSQLIAVRARWAEAGARLAKIRRLLKTPNGVESANEVLDSPLIRQLREQETRLRSIIAELNPELGPKHPRMQRLRNEEADLQSRIDSEISKIVAGLQNEVDVAASRVATLEQELASAKNEVASANEKAVELRALQREVDANRGLLTSLLNQQKATQPQNEAGFLLADARIISPATVPTDPAFPNGKLVFGLSTVSAVMLGALLILLIETLDNGFRSAEQIDAETDARALGFVPRSRFSKRGGELKHLHDRPSSAFAESIRTLLWSIKLEFGGDDCKVLLFTSAKPGEGKTTIASSIAWTQAKAGKHVLVIDADLRRPAVHSRLGHRRAPGLTDYLAGQRSLGQVQGRRDALPGICVIGAGDPDIDVQNLLANGRLQELLTALRPRFDLILVDSPPVLVGADARLLCRLADATVMVVQWGDTQRQAVKLSLKRLRDAGALAVGAVLSQVDAKKYANYGYGDAGAYTGDLAKYYAAG